MKRQLIEVRRDHAQGIDKMVLECAAEAAGPVEPVYEPIVRRINATIHDVSTIGHDRSFNDRVFTQAGAARPCTVSPPMALHETMRPSAWRRTPKP